MSATIAPTAPEVAVSPAPAPTRSLRIALHNVTTTTKHGGVETFVWELARQLGAAGHRVDLIGGSGGGGLRGTPGPGVRVRRAPFIRREWLRRLPVVSRLYGPTKLIERLSFGVTTLPLAAAWPVRHPPHPEAVRSADRRARAVPDARAHAPRLRLPRAGFLRGRSALDRRGRCDRLVQRDERRRGRGALRPRAARDLQRHRCGAVRAAPADDPAVRASRRNA